MDIGCGIWSIFVASGTVSKSYFRLSLDDRFVNGGALYLGNCKHGDTCDIGRRCVYEINGCMD